MAYCLHYFWIFEFKNKMFHRDWYILLCIYMLQYLWKAHNILLPPSHIYLFNFKLTHISSTKRFYVNIKAGQKKKTSQLDFLLLKKVTLLAFFLIVSLEVSFVQIRSGGAGWVESLSRQQKNPSLIVWKDLLLAYRHIAGI